MSTQDQAGPGLAGGPCRFEKSGTAPVNRAAGDRGAADRAIAGGDNAAGKSSPPARSGRAAGAARGVLRVLGVAGALCAFLAFPAAAAPAAPAAPALEPSATVIDRDHRLRAGDRVEIRVNGMEGFSRTVRLYHDGTFDYPVLGKVRAIGLTTTELAAHITTGLQGELRRPAVTVTLQEVYVPANGPRVTVLGAATTQGVVALPEPKPLRALLAQVGPTEKADLTQIRVRYPNGAERTADYSQFSVTGEVKDEIFLQGGEEIVLLERPEARKPAPLRITVLGEVLKPGTVDVEEGATILDALEKAGGAKPAADLAHVAVEGPAHPRRRAISVERLLAGDTASGYTVQRGDVLVVPEKPVRVVVCGEVSKPGEFRVDENTTILDVYLLAGASKDADPGRAQLVRRSSDGKPVVQNVNLLAIMQGKALDHNALQSGDVLFIPSKKSKRGMMERLNWLSAPLLLLRGL